MSLSRVDILLVWTLRACAAIAGVVVLVVLLFLMLESIPALVRIGPLRFLTDPAWHPAASDVRAEFNLLPMVWGTLLVSAGALALGGPTGVLAAVFLQYYGTPALAGGFRRVVELLAGIPSVVYGFWGLTVLVPLINRLHPPGPSLLAGILILALMILPTITLLADIAIAAVPQEYIRGAVALGLSRPATLCGVVLPAARSGLFAGVLLGFARALGETMAMIMVCGNVVQTPTHLFDPVRTLTANIALEMAYAMGDHGKALFATGLLLMLLVIALVALTEHVHRPGTRG